MKANSWSKRGWRWLVVFIYLLGIGFLALPGIQISSLTIPEDYTKDFLPDLTLGYGLTSSNVYRITPTKPADQKRARLQKYAAVIQERLNDPLIKSGIFKVKVEKTSVAVHIADANLDTNILSLLTTQGQIELVLSKETSDKYTDARDTTNTENPPPDPTTLLANYDSIEIDRRHIQNLYIRKNEDTYYFVMTFTSQGFEKLQNLFLQGAANKILALRIDDRVTPLSLFTLDTLAQVESGITFIPPYVQDSSFFLIPLVTGRALPGPVTFTDLRRIPPFTQSLDAMNIGLAVIGACVIAMWIVSWRKHITLTIFLQHLLPILHFPAATILMYKFTHLPFSMISLILMFGYLIWLTMVIGYLLWHSHHDQKVELVYGTRIVTWLLFLPAFVLLFLGNPYQLIGQNIIILSINYYLSVGFLKLLHRSV